MLGAPIVAASAGLRRALCLQALTYRHFDLIYQTRQEPMVLCNAFGSPDAQRGNRQPTYKALPHETSRLEVVDA